MKCSDNDFWYTPEYILQAVRGVLGNDYFDPCPINPTFDGLDVTWGRNCFINPPYSRKLKKAFIHKGTKEIKKEGKEYIWLVNYRNSVDVSELVRRARSVCIPKQRIKFLRPDGTVGGSPRFDSIIIYWGNTPSKFDRNFYDLGGVFTLP